MGFFKRAVSLVQNSAIRQTAEHLQVRGGVEKQAEIINTVSEELSGYLRSFKGKHITKEQLQNYYHEVFPELKIKISGEKLEKDMLCTSPIAATECPYRDGVYKGEMVMNINSKNIWDKIKGIFGHKNEDKFWVSSKFVDSFVHENTHIMQAYMKPTDKIYQKALKHIVDKRHGGSKRWFDYHGIDGSLAYQYRVYKEEFPLLFSQKKFAQRIIGSISPYYAENDVKIAHLKNFIRSAENEKQAYIQGELNKMRFNFPHLSKISFIDDLFRRKSERSIRWFKFDSKIDAMKQEYYRLIEAERAANRHAVIA